MTGEMCKRSAVFIKLGMKTYFLGRSDRLKKVFYWIYTYIREMVMVENVTCPTVAPGTFIYSRS